MDRAGIFQVRCGVLERYGDVLTPAVFEAMAALAPLDDTRRRLMRQRIERRRARAAGRLHLTFLAPETAIGSSGLTAADARAGRFEGAEIEIEARSLDPEKPLAFLVWRSTLDGGPWYAAFWAAPEGRWLFSVSADSPELREALVAAFVEASKAASG